MNVAQDIPPPAYHEVHEHSRPVPPRGPPPPYCSHEEIWQALQQTDADGTSFELPPSYEEVIAGISLEDNSPPDARPSSSAPHEAAAFDLSGSQLIQIRRPAQEGNRGYGFAFRDGRVTVVLPNSAAQLAGLAEGSRLIEVNGSNVESQNKDFICQRIQQRPEGVTLLVEPPMSQANAVRYSFVLQKPPQGYGFAFRGVHISVVLPNSVAGEAGLHVGDSLVKINGFSTAGRNRAGLLELVNLHSDQVSLTISRRGPCLQPMQAKFFRLRRSPFTGFGFAFRGNRVSALLPGSEAERNGLRIGDRLLQVNDHNVHGLSKNGILRLISLHSDVVSLWVLPDG
ncbi:hypothetical protein CAPTEDRAFT_228690 [Capitella teleta]|uniref:PDZ domain-containing protein n=1 Tax=Capitella teleta TaxID=283909 RepID=R7TDV2_CAPTE|nr:hypothetical protein CAPTEDRAFT_228690 [Capitella teleta]|eukprot:ELT91889.1 hypothetical protein CAPTEDRAFT_228690 [Capitella teleta]